MQSKIKRFASRGYKFKRRVNNSGSPSESSENETEARLEYVNQGNALTRIEEKSFEESMNLTRTHDSNNTLSDHKPSKTIMLANDSYNEADLDSPERPAEPGVDSLTRTRSDLDLGRLVNAINKTEITNLE